MPITLKDDDGELWEDRGREVDENGIVTMPRTWLLEVTPEVDGSWPTLADITDFVEVDMYDEHPEEPRCIARSCSLKAHESQYAFKLTINYSDSPLKGDGGWPDEQDPENPQKKDKNNATPAHLRPPQVSFARKESKIAPTEDRDGDPVVNKAGDAIEDLEIDKSILQITIKFFSIKITVPHIVKYWNSTNSDAYQGLSSGTLKCVDYQFEWSYENIGDFTALVMAATLVLEHNPDGWGVTVMNRGRREIPAGGGPLRWITDDSGQPVSDPVPLTIAGQRLPVGDAPNYITFHFNKAWTYTTIVAAPLAIPPVVGQVGIIV